MDLREKFILLGLEVVGERLKFLFGTKVVERVWGNIKRCLK